jgi:hypothetical protein
MKTIFTASVLCTVATLALSGHNHACAQMTAQPKVPAEVSATLPAATKTFLLQRASLGPDGADVLVHIWGATRPNRADSLNRYNRFASSPFCIDIFTWKLGAGNHLRWHLTSSAAYIATDLPSLLRTHWLHPAIKQGPVLEVVSSNGAPGVSTVHTLLVWDKGFQEGYPSPSPQLFFSGGLGGGTIMQKFDEVDALGTMAVKSIDSYVGQVKSVTTFRWDGRSFRADKADEGKAP